MSSSLNGVEVRVLGCLVEKEMATPEYYPLSLNALVTACNQKSNREPVVEYDEATVSEGLERLRARKLAVVITGREVRVPKHAHRCFETLDVGNRELALLAVLMLRGPQTAAELKERSQRLYAFDDVESVETCLGRLAEREMAARLERQPGTREARWAQLLGGAVEPAAAAVGVEAKADRVTRLEAEVAELRAVVMDLKQKVEVLFS
ncbi:MAG: YceH family protein [Bryobacteraceae bacterium]